jgi:hypothetical protein
MYVSINVDSSITLAEQLTVREELKGDDVDKTLQTIDRCWYSDSSDSSINGLVIFVADDNCGAEEIGQLADLTAGGISAYSVDLYGP